VISPVTGLMVKVPFDGPEPEIVSTDVGSILPSASLGSLSLATISIVTGVSSFVVSTSSTAKG